MHRRPYQMDDKVFFILVEKERMFLVMNKRIAIIGIIIEDNAYAGQVNEILHSVSEYIVGRMGVPYRDRSVNVISIIVDAPQDVINSLAGKIGRIPGVTAKAIYSKEK